MKTLLKYLRPKILKSIAQNRYKSLSFNTYDECLEFKFFIQFGDVGLLSIDDYLWMQVTWDTRKLKENLLFIFKKRKNWFDEPAKIRIECKKCALSDEDCHCEYCSECFILWCDCDCKCEYYEYHPD